MQKQKFIHSKSRSRLFWSFLSTKLRKLFLKFPPLLVLRAEKLVRTFVHKKRLALALSDRYLMKLWGNVSRSTVQRTLCQFEQLGILKRITSAPTRDLDGNWHQERKLILHSPKNTELESPNLVCHSAKRLELQGNLVDKKLTSTAKLKPFVDYLCEQQRVSKGAWAHWLRQNDARGQTMGYLLSTIYRKIKHRPDVLESVIFDGISAKLVGSKLVGYVVSEINIRC